MVFNIFKRTEKQTKISELNKKFDLYETTVKGLDRIEREGIDRVILYVGEIEPKDTQARFINANETNYYSFELLLEDEQKMMLDGKHYQVIALVTKEVMGQRVYPARGIEVYDRTYFHLYLSALKKSSNLNYISKGYIYTEENGLADLCKTQESGWTPEMFEKGLEQGINWYKDQTRTLINNHKGLQEGLRKTQERDCSPIEQILKEIRSNLK